ncbi:MAG: hypothetical protein C5S47_05340 [Candidatus Methanogasteraceae archaeon]|nr:MAG: hypothetical protein C5S47_05340 [ANME-2 cluster archaeon]
MWTMFHYGGIHCFGHSTFLHITCVKADMFDIHLLTINLSVHRNETCTIVCITELHGMVNHFPARCKIISCKTQCICDLSKQYPAILILKILSGINDPKQQKKIKLR